MFLKFSIKYQNKAFLCTKNILKSRYRLDSFFQLWHRTFSNLSPHSKYVKLSFPLGKTPSQIAHVHIRSDLHAIAHFPLRGPFNFVIITFIPPITNKGANVCDYTKLHHHHHLQPFTLSSSPIVFFFFFLLLLSHVAGRRVSEQVKSKCQRLNAHSSSSLLQQLHRVRSNTRSSNATTLLCCAL